MLWLLVSLLQACITPFTEFYHLAEFTLIYLLGEKEQATETDNGLQENSKQCRKKHKYLVTRDHKRFPVIIKTIITGKKNRIKNDKVETDEEY